MTLRSRGRYLSLRTAASACLLSVAALTVAASADAQTAPSPTDAPTDATTTAPAALLAATVSGEIAQPPSAPSPSADPPPVSPAPVVLPAPVSNAGEASAPPSAPPMAPAAPLAALADDESRPRLDYSDGVFYLRSPNDHLVLVPGLRAHIDTYSFQGPRVASYHRSNGTGLKTNLFFRRFVLEFGGMIRKKYFFWIGANLAPTQVDANQNSISTANVYDGFVGYVPVPTQRIYFGAYNAPFTMENVTSSRWLDMMERALIVRTVATPYNKAEGIMLWGNTEHRSFEYQAGVFGGDGMNRPNVDNRFDVMGRVVLRPLTSRSDAMGKLHVGGSARFGSRDPKFARYDAPNLTTPGGYAFWQASYGSGDKETHIMPAGHQLALAAEAYVPFERFDVRAEVVYVDEDRREALASDRSHTLRVGALRGYGGYGQVSVWLLGTPRISGNPAGYYGVTKLPTGPGSQHLHALQLVLRGELVRLNYDSNSHRGDRGGVDAATHNINVNVYQGCLNYWATKHLRLTAEYSLYAFPGAGSGENASNQALAPGAKAGRADARTLNEFSFRVGLAL